MPRPNNPSRSDESSLVSLAHLRVLIQVADSGSAALAAEQLFRAPSAVTRSIRELETFLAIRLFERRPSGMLCTATGRVVLERARRVFLELAQLAVWCSRQPSRAPSDEPAAVPSFLLSTSRLQILLAIGRHRHMPSAAQALGLSQPAISAALRVLESGAGAPLFYRNARGLLPTDIGERFILHARRALNEVRHVPDDIAATEGRIGGHVVIGALPLGRTLILPEAVARVSRDFPGVRVTTDESHYEVLVRELRAGDIDFILGALRASDEIEGLAVEALMSEDMVVLARHDHPLAGVARLTLAALADARWILQRNHTPARTILDGLFASTGLRAPIPAVETADLAMIRGLLLRTDMIAVLSAHQLHYERVAGQLVALDLPMSATRREIGLTMRASGAASPAAHAVIRAVREVVRELF